MQAYNASFARIYNLRWASFAQNTAPRLRAFYEMTPVGQDNRSMLDLCCGTGQLALHFLDHGYRVTGRDMVRDADVNLPHSDEARRQS